MIAFPESELARRFRQHVLADVDYLKSRGYNPTRFLGRVINQEQERGDGSQNALRQPRFTSEDSERLWEMES